MTTVLQILVSPRLQAWSWRLAAQIVDRIEALRHDVRVVTRDLAAEPPPYPGRDLNDAILTPTPDDDPRNATSPSWSGPMSW